MEEANKGTRVFIEPHPRELNPIATKDRISFLAEEVLMRCSVLASFSEHPFQIERKFLSKPMHETHEQVSKWMSEAGMAVRIDAIGNIIGRYEGNGEESRTLLIGSHLDTVPNAGRYDGILGVMLGIAMVEALEGRRLPYSIEVIGFSDEEGIRYSVPFLGSRAKAGTFDPGLLQLTDRQEILMADAIRSFGLDPDQLDTCKYSPENLLGYLEAHIEQGPVLENEDLPVAVVDSIAGQTRCQIVFEGFAGHAGTTPMYARRDALAGAAEFALEIERVGKDRRGLRATVGRFDPQPNVANVIPDSVLMSMDLRHRDNEIRMQVTDQLLEIGKAIAKKRGLRFTLKAKSIQEAIEMDEGLCDALEQAVGDEGINPVRIISGAGHDAMVMASITPSAMLFLRCKDGMSHYPDESVETDDVRVALDVLVRTLDKLGRRHSGVYRTNGISPDKG